MSATSTAGRSRSDPTARLSDTPDPGASRGPSFRGYLATRPTASAAFDPADADVEDPVDVDLLPAPRDDACLRFRNRRRLDLHIGADDADVDLEPGLARQAEAQDAGHRINVDTGSGIRAHRVLLP